MLHNDTLYVLDEMSQVKAQEAGEIVYMLANGQGKVRSMQDTSAQAVRRWQLMFLSTGEIGLEQHIESGGGRAMAGQQSRLIDIPADAGSGLGVFENIHGHRDGAEFSLFVKAQCASYHGMAGRTWVSALADMSQRPIILDAIRTDIDRFTTTYVPTVADGQISRVGRRFGLVAAVGEACIRLGILPWEAGTATQAIQLCFAQWMANRGGGIGSMEQDQARNQLRRFLEAHGESRFTEIGMHDDDEVANPNRTTINRVGFRKLAADGLTDYFFLPEAWKTEVCAGMNPREFTKQLRAANVLVLGNDGKSQVTMRLPGLGTVKVYHVRSSVIGDVASS